MELCHVTYMNCASHVLTVNYAPNQEATSLLHDVDSDLLTKHSPSQGQLLGTLYLLTFMIVELRQHLRNISRLFCLTQQLINVIILTFYFLKFIIRCC